MLKSFFLLKDDLLGNILNHIYQKKSILFLLLKKKELPYFSDEKTGLYYPNAFNMQRYSESLLAVQITIN